SEHEHEVIMETIISSNENLSLNVLNILEKMEFLSMMNNSMYDDCTIEIFFLKKVLQEEFDKLSSELFKLLEKMYSNHEVEFDSCKRAFKYFNNDVVGLSPKMYDFMSNATVSHLKKIHNELYNTSKITIDHNLENIIKLIEYDNKHINISALIAVKNYEFESKDVLKMFLVDEDDDLKSLVNKIIRQSDEVTSYEKIAYLSKVPLFASLSFDELYNLAKKSNIVEYEVNQEIISQGDRANNLYILLSGEVEIIKNNEKINELHSSDYFGEIAIVAKTKRTATVRAINDVVTLVFSEKAFNEIINNYPNISVQIMKEMTKRLLQNTA
ncbi:MAG: cyclic nucleotide-binding domain-containing protein, partial [Thiovulaceae bacterium]|nr:cyclic nucleotide-binding domain-containing protein [Sulfurimonadaceae bacterium]